MRHLVNCFHTQQEDGARRPSQFHPLKKVAYRSVVLSLIILHCIVDVVHEQNVPSNSSPAATGLIQTVEGKRSSRIATMSRGKDSTDGIVLMYHIVVVMCVKYL